MNPTLDEDSALLRIFIGESDRYQGKPLYETLILMARREGLAGATALRGMMGYGASSRIHAGSILRLSEDLPIVVEIVDAPGKVEAFLQKAESLLQGGHLATIEKARVIRYAGRQGDSGGTTA